MCMENEREKAMAEEKKMSLEETFAEIENVITQMEQPEVSLDESFRLYQQGVAQLKVCNELLDEVEKKIQVIAADGSPQEW